MRISCQLRPVILELDKARPQIMPNLTSWMRSASASSATLGTIEMCIRDRYRIPVLARYAWSQGPIRILWDRAGGVTWMSLWTRRGNAGCASGFWMMPTSPPATVMEGWRINPYIPNAIWITIPVSYTHLDVYKRQV